MAFDIQATLKAVQSHLMASGHVKVAVLGEPKSPLRDEEVFAGVWMDKVRVAELTVGHVLCPLCRRRWACVLRRSVIDGASEPFSNDVRAQAVAERKKCEWE